MASHDNRRNDFRQRLCDDMEKLFQNKDSADVTFNIPDGKVRAHKSILMTRVPVFEAMFSSGMKESQTNEVEILDSDFKSFEVFLRFIYCGKLPETEFDIQLEKNLIILANKYDAPNLLDHCLPKFQQRHDPFSRCAVHLPCDNVAYALSL